MQDLVFNTKIIQGERRRFEGADLSKFLAAQDKGLDDTRGEEKIPGSRSSSLLFNPKAKPLFNQREASYLPQYIRDKKTTK